MKEQRKIVQYLIDYHSRDDLKHEDKIDAVKFGVKRRNFFAYVSKRMFGVTVWNITEENREQWKKIRYLIDECIDDGYLKEEKSESFTTANSSDNESMTNLGDNIFLTSEGKKLAKNSYFYFKYLPETFPQPTNILITIITGIITAIITTLITVNLIPEKKEQTSQPQSIDKQQVEISLPKK